MVEYIEMFYDKVDVVEDLISYLELLNKNEDIEALTTRI